MTRRPAGSLTPPLTTTPGPRTAMTSPQPIPPLTPAETRGTRPDRAEPMIGFSDNLQVADLDRLPFVLQVPARHAMHCQPATADAAMHRARNEAARLLKGGGK